MNSRDVDDLIDMYALYLKDRLNAVVERAQREHDQQTEDEWRKAHAKWLAQWKPQDGA